MGDGLKINVDRIQELSDSLTEIRREFDNSPNPMQDSDISTAGHQDVLDVFDTFESNWSVMREGLVEQLKKLASISGNAADAHGNVERELIEALLESDEAVESEAGQ